jgi:Ca2+-binding RTX toxin-like protein
MATYIAATRTWELADDETDFTIPVDSPANSRIRGNALSNRLVGDGSQNRLNGGGGADILVGGLGDDFYVIDDPGDVILEEGSDFDSVTASISYSLVGTLLEDLTLTGTEDLAATGNEAANVLAGNSGTNVLDSGAGNDFLDGGAGADRMIGGIGNDDYVVDDPGDVIVELAGEGTDQVSSFVSYDLSGTHVENIKLAGSANLNAAGNDLDNRLRGNDGINILTGRKGNDTYVVQSSDDVVVELQDEGIDTVEANCTYSLAGFEHVENLTLIGTQDYNATGNDRPNVITGNYGENILDGRAGADVLDGGDSSDTLHGGAGDDVLKGGIYHDTLDGGTGVNTAAFSGRESDYIVTRSGSTITVQHRNNGPDGTDTLTNIRFARFEAENKTVALINSAPTVALSHATVAENAPAFTQVGRLSAMDVDGDAISFSLAANPDGAFAIANGYLVLARPLDFEAKAQYSVSVKATDAYGAETTQSFTVTATDVAEHLVLRGTTAANVLVGGSGNDTLYGGAGKDVLTGSSGQDVFVFDTRPNTRTNVDTLTDFSAADDSIQLDNKYLKKLGSGSVSKPGKLKAAFFKVADKAKDGNDHLVYNRKTGVLSYDEDGSGTKAAVAIAKLSNKASLTKNDFFVI